MAFRASPSLRAAFASKPLTPSSFSTNLRKHPFAFFGLPFVLTVVAGSFALSQLTQTRYDHRDAKVKSVSKEQELGMRKDRRKLDIREEYFRLQASGEMDDMDYENKRVERLPGQGEWGELPVAKK
ncbi:hypothetical protein MNV49_000121 [Pseudohyphozyma bogoriensis]|nr:hypothetical protein MNV49_000121 [Pseudohyphozyma bogoriensis]